MPENPIFNIVLMTPEIPGNTGAIGRTCLALGARLHLIKPYGFSLDKKELRRAGLDYWQYVDLHEHDSFEELIQEHRPHHAFFFSKKAKHPLFQAKFTRQCWLIFGPETSGLNQDILEKYKSQLFKLPMYSKHVRSLNLANAVTAAGYEALRQINF